jgi:hypothetical protein
MTNPEDYVDTVNNKMGMSLVTTAAGASTTNSVSVWDFAMVSFSWVEDANHPEYSVPIHPHRTAPSSPAHPRPLCPQPWQQPKE